MYPQGMRGWYSKQSFETDLHFLHTYASGCESVINKLSTSKKFQSLHCTNSAQHCHGVPGIVDSPWHCSDTCVCVCVCVCVSCVRVHVHVCVCVRTSQFCLERTVLFFSGGGEGEETWLASSRTMCE